MKKQRCDAWYGNLTVERQEKLRSVVLGMSWEKAVATISEQCNIVAPSRTAYFKWLKHMGKMPDPTCPFCAIAATRTAELEADRDYLREQLAAAQQNLALALSAKPPPAAGRACGAPAGGARPDRAAKTAG